jgi:GT2 family glycosyltransferase
MQKIFLTIPHNMMLLMYLIRQGSLWTILKLFVRYRLSGHRHQPVSLEKALRSVRKKIIRPKILVHEPIDIVIPVYNGFMYFEKLFDSLFRNTNLPFRLIIVEDCSSDPQVLSFLQTIKADNPDKTLLIQNTTNRGFAESVNIGVQQTKNHFVILNTDVEIPPNWLSRLMAPIFSGNRIASTTPFSNAADIYSFPEFPQNNPIFEDIDVAALDAFFQHVRTGGSGIEIPTGMGFCMGFNRNTVNQIGMFDQKTFGLGYCEENDWCMRAKKAGFQNILVPNLFVYHKQGASFDDQKKKQLLQKNYWRLVQRHKEYLPAIYGFTAMDPLIHIREIMILIISANSGSSPKSIELFTDPNTGKQRLRYSFKQYEFVFTFEERSTLKELFSWIPLEKVNFQIMDGFPNQEEIEKIMTPSYRA